jgi:hypothetical protein
MRISSMICIAMLAIGCQQHQPEVNRPAYVRAADSFLAGADTLPAKTTNTADSAAITDLAFELRKIPDLLEARRTWDQERTWMSNDTAWVNYRVRSRTGTEMLQIILVRHSGGWQVIVVAVPTRI